MSEHSFSTTLPILIYTCSTDNCSPADWQEFDRGPGIFHLPEGIQVMVRIRNIDNRELETLVGDLRCCPEIKALNLSENRKVDDAGLARLAPLTQLTDLNLSSVSMSSEGLAVLKYLSRLTRLNLSYCNRITDEGLRVIKTLNRLVYLDLQGCPKITTNGIAKIRRNNLNINR